MNDIDKLAAIIAEIEPNFDPEACVDECIDILVGSPTATDDRDNSTGDIYAVALKLIQIGLQHRGDAADRGPVAPTPGQERLFYVNVYAVDRVYGGPEEGGWWFSIGTPLDHYDLMSGIEDPELHPHQGEDVHWVFNSHNEIQAERLAAQLRQPDWFPSTGKQYSVLGGEDYEVRIEDHPPRPWPVERPRYE